MGPGGIPYVEASQLGQYGPAATLNLATLAQQQQAHGLAQQQHGLEAQKTAHDMQMAEAEHKLAVKESNKPTPKPAKAKGGK